MAVVFSGQGAQKVGMGRDLAAAFPVARELIERADASLGRPLSAIMFDGPEDELTRPANCQPAPYVHGLACLPALGATVGTLEPAAVAGLSLGEFTAHAAAGTFDFGSGLRLVEQRGTFMEEACRATNGGMAVLIGGDEAAVRALAADCDIDVANLNAPGQIVVSGEAAKVATAVSLAREKGIRMARELKVAGAYHSRLMQLAYEKFAAPLEAAELRAPRLPVVCNVDGRPVAGAAEIRRSLHEQVTSTVRWVDCVEHMIDELGCSLFIELGPGGVLAGLINRIRKDTRVISVENAESLERARAEIAALGDA